MAELSIRPSAYEDIPALAVIEQQTFRATYPGVTPEVTDEMVRLHTTEQWRNGREHTILGHYQNGGSVLSAHVGDLAVGYSLVENGGVHLNSLHVDPRCQGRRIGSWLLVAQASQGMFKDGMSLHVVPGTPAERMYRGLGMQEVYDQEAADGLQLGGGGTLPLVKLCMDGETSQKAMQALYGRIATRDDATHSQEQL